MPQEIAELSKTTNPVAEQLATDQPSSAEADICDNCGTILNGPYCHKCGQSSRSMIKFIGLLFKEVLDDVVGYDSRLKHTVFPLLFQPGQITNDYIKGRRFYYVLPLRLYLITSLLFILLLKFTTDPTKLVNEQANKGVQETQIEQSVENPPDNNPQGNSSDSLNLKSESSRESSVAENEKGREKETTIDDQDFGINITGSGIEFQGDEFKQDGFLKEFAQEIEKKWQGWLKDPKPLVKQVIELLPYMMFILLPIFAIFLKVFYLFSKRFYIEHFIFLLHNHCFIYAALMLQIGLDYAEALNKSSNWLFSSIGHLAGLLSVLLAWWIFIYVFISMRKVYQQGWVMTVGKGIFLGIIYFSLISMGFIVTLLAGAYFA